MKDNKIVEILSSVVAIVMVQIIFSFLLELTPLANYIGVKYEDQYYNKNIYVDGKVRSYILEETQRSLDNIPESLRSMFYKNGGMINVTNKEYEGSYIYKSATIKYKVVGSFYYASDEDYCINIMDNLSQIKRGTLEHEFGHYLDRLFEVVSEKKLFEDAYLNEYQNFKEYINEDNYYNDKNEYFAECFSIYINETKKLKKYCPKTYSVIDLLMDDVEVCTR